MTLEFTREVIILNGLPVLGTIEVDVEFERDEYDGLFAIHLTCASFEPEAPLTGLRWSAVEVPCHEWLKANRDRVEREALKPRE